MTTTPGLREVTISPPNQDTRAALGEEGLATVISIPPEAQALYLFGHGAGAGMHHRFMKSMAERLAHRRVATLRWNFPYMQAGRSFPDRPSKLVAAVRAVAAFAVAEYPQLPLFAGGKSMGGRMVSTAEAEQTLGVQGLVFLGFPLHPAGKPSTARAEHLARVDIPMRFIRGERDALADPDLMRQVVDDLDPSARLVTIAAADHGFDVLKRSGRDPGEVLNEVADHAAEAMWR